MNVNKISQLLVPVFSSTTVNGEKRMLLAPGNIGRDALFHDVHNGAEIFSQMADEINVRDLRRRISIIRGGLEEGLKAVAYLTPLHAYLDGYEDEFCQEEDIDIQHINERLKDEEYENSQTIFPVITLSKLNADLNPAPTSALLSFSDAALQGGIRQERKDFTPYYRNQTSGPVVLVYNERTMPFSDLGEAFEIFSGNRRVYLLWQEDRDYEDYYGSFDDSGEDDEDDDVYENCSSSIVEYSLKYNASVYSVEEWDREKDAAYMAKLFTDLADQKGMKLSADFPVRKIVEKLVVTDGFRARFLSQLLDRVHESTDTVGDSTLKYFGKVIRKNPDAATAGMPNLESMVGMAEVKAQVDRFIKTLRFKKDRAKRGITTPVPSTVLMLGPAGTGKTETAKALANMAYEAGVISRKEVISFTGTGLCGEYLGQTRAKVEEICHSARGAVLFIDEAYSLSSNSDGRGPDLYSAQAIAQLLVEIDQAAIRGDTIIILAGYEDKMMSFLTANPGLRSRCSNQIIRFKAYSPEEATDIYFGICEREKFSTAAIKQSPEVREKLVSYFGTIEHQFAYGNGRSVRNLVLNTVTAVADRLSANKEGTDKEDYSTILPDDVGRAIEESLKMMGDPSVGKKISILGKE